MATVLPGRQRLWPCLLWAVQGHEGPFSGWDQAFQDSWVYKDQLPERGLAWAGHLWGTQVMLVHASLLPVFLGARGSLDVEELYQEGGLSQACIRVYRALASGPVGRAELRKTLKLGAGEFDRACRDLERLLVITRCGTVTEGPGWGANRYALVEQHFGEVVGLPFGQARAALEEVLSQAAPTASEAQRKRWLKALSG